MDKNVLGYHNQLADELEGIAHRVTEIANRRDFKNVRTQDMVNDTVTMFRAAHALRDLPKVGEVTIRVDPIKISDEEIERVLQKIRNAPIMAMKSEDVPPRIRARWIALDNPNYSPFDGSPEYTLLCSGCGATLHGPDNNFCPNCGADMRELVNA